MIKLPKIPVTLITLLWAILLAMCLQIPAGALTHEEAVRESRNVLEVKNGDSREYQINYSVWSDEKVRRSIEPADFIFLLEDTGDMDCLLESPEGNICYYPGLSYVDKIGEKTVLYTEREKVYVPVVLSQGVWKTHSGDEVGKRQEGTDSFTEKVYERGSVPTRREHIRDELKNFLNKLWEISPESQIGIRFFGGEASVYLPSQPVGENLAAMLAELTTWGLRAGEKRLYASALEQAAKDIEKRKSEKPVYLITISCGDRDADDDEIENGVNKSMLAIKQIREMGGKAYCILLNSEDDEKSREFWSSMVSAPLTTYFHQYYGSGEKQLNKVISDVFSTFSVNVVQNLDSRFTIAPEERTRLRQSGAKIQLNPDNSWSIQWEVEMPCSNQSPWTASLAVNTRDDFPGGNDISIDSEGSGIYKSGKRIVGFSPENINIPVHLAMWDEEQTLFLGEAIKIRTNNKSIEETMIKHRQPNWYGRGQTGTFSYIWEDENGTALGTLEQLAQARPRVDRVYRLRVIFTPATTGRGTTGEPVERLEETACLRIHVVSGTVKIKAEAESITSNDSILFMLEGQEITLYKEANLETDLQSGKQVLETEFTGLPYGCYTVTALTYSEYIENNKTCLLGICKEDDTVDTGRSYAEAKFFLKTTPAEGLPSKSASKNISLVVSEDGEAL